MKLWKTCMIVSLLRVISFWPSALFGSSESARSTAATALLGSLRVVARDRPLEQRRDAAARLLVLRLVGAARPRRPLRGSRALRASIGSNGSTMSASRAFGRAVARCLRGGSRVADRAYVGLARRRVVVDRDSRAAVSAAQPELARRCARRRSRAQLEVLGRRVRQHRPRPARAASRGGAPVRAAVAADRVIRSERRLASARALGIDRDRTRRTGCARTCCLRRLARRLAAASSGRLERSTSIVAPCGRIELELDRARCRSRSGSTACPSPAEASPSACTKPRSRLSNRSVSCCAKPTGVPSV